MFWSQIHLPKVATTLPVCPEYGSPTNLFLGRRPLDASCCSSREPQALIPQSELSRRHLATTLAYCLWVGWYLDANLQRTSFPVSFCAFQCFLFAFFLVLACDLRAGSAASLLVSARRTVLEARGIASDTLFSSQSYRNTHGQMMPAAITYQASSLGKVQPKDELILVADSYTNKCIAFQRTSGTAPLLTRTLHRQPSRSNNVSLPTIDIVLSCTFSEFWWHLESTAKGNKASRDCFNQGKWRANIVPTVKWSDT